MGETLGVTCGACSHGFDVDIGAGMIAVAARCDRCGAEGSVPSPLASGDWAGDDTSTESCECGGTFDVDAPFRCPHCGATYSEDELRGLPTTMFGLWD